MPQQYSPSLQAKDFASPTIQIDQQRQHTAQERMDITQQTTAQIAELQKNTMSEDSNKSDTTSSCSQQESWADPEIVHTLPATPLSPLLPPASGDVWDHFLTARSMPDEGQSTAEILSSGRESPFAWDQMGTSRATMDLDVVPSPLTPSSMAPGPSNTMSFHVPFSTSLNMDMGSSAGGGSHVWERALQTGSELDVEALVKECLSGASATNTAPTGSLGETIAPHESGQTALNAPRVSVTESVLDFGMVGHTSQSVSSTITNTPARYPYNFLATYFKAGNVPYTPASSKSPPQMTPTVSQPILIDETPPSMFTHLDISLYGGGSPSSSAAASQSKVKEVKFHTPLTLNTIVADLQPKVKRKRSGKERSISSPNAEKVMHAQSALAPAVVVVSASPSVSQMNLTEIGPDSTLLRFSAGGECPH
jgi:hypothetical protein